MKKTRAFLAPISPPRIGRVQLAYAGISLVWFFIAVNLPYCGDDLIWGSPDGITELLAARTNSRYVGNAIEIVMTRSSLLKTLILASVYSLIPSLTANIVRQATKASPEQALLPYLTANALILGMHSIVWRQTYGWIAGAANFVVSFLFVLVYILLILKDAAVSRPRAQSIAGCLLLGIAMQLFIENLAIAMVAISFAVSVYLGLYRKRPCFRALSLLLGNLVGVGIMFSSSMYKTLFQTGNAVGGYRELSFRKGASVLSIAKNGMIYLIAKIVPSVYQEYAIAATVVIVLSVAFLLFRQEKRQIFCACVAGLTVCVTGYMLGAKYGLLPLLFSGSRYMHLLHSLIVCGGLFLLVALGIILIFSREGRQAQLAVALGGWIAAPLVVAPLCVTTELGARLFVTPLLFLVLVAALLAQTAAASMGQKGKRLCTALMAAAVVVLSAKWIWVYHSIGTETAARRALYADAAPGQTVYVSPYTYGQYLHAAESGAANEYYLRFFGLPEGASVIFRTEE